MTARCPEGVIVDGVVIQCRHDGGHDGNHAGVTDRGTAEWARIIQAGPLADWELELICLICGVTCCGVAHETPF